MNPNQIDYNEFDFVMLLYYIRVLDVIVEIFNGTTGALNINSYYTL